ncbi:MAG: hypothetical protein KU38_05140 [Sulfurovum sp. FS08-3]|nr:MAG: hypothetical protein KU38_05140 [Sulfurovum sp. FS08-3]
MKATVLTQLKQLKNKYQNIGFYIVGVFGSYAREEQTLQSDIDIVYSVDKSFIHRYGGWGAIVEIEKIKQDIQTTLGIPKVDLATSDSNNQTLQKAIKESIIYV